MQTNILSMIRHLKLELIFMKVKWSYFKYPMSIVCFLWAREFADDSKVNAKMDAHP